MADFYTFGSGGLQEAVRQVFAKLKTLLDEKYSKPAGGIPKTDLASGVQTSLGLADTAYQKPSGGIPASDMAQEVQTSLGLADSALQEVPNTYRTAAAQDVIDATKQPTITASGILKGDGAGGVSAATPGTDYQKPIASTAVSAAGVISYLDASDNVLFSVQLPLYNGGVS